MPLIPFFSVKSGLILHALKEFPKQSQKNVGVAWEIRLFRGVFRGYLWAAWALLGSSLPEGDYQTYMTQPKAQD